MSKEPKRSEAQRQGKEEMVPPGPRDNAEETASLDIGVCYNNGGHWSGQLFQKEEADGG